jgi:arsenical pump membrane protein
MGFGMTQQLQAIAAYSLLGATVSLAIARPKMGPIRFHHTHAGVLGAILVVSLGLVPVEQLTSALHLLSLPVVTIVSLMTITLAAEQAGVFRLLTQSIARLARGNGRRLFALLYVSGVITGTLFTNDAAILIFTPLVFALIENVKQPGWTLANKTPFYFGVLYVANMTGALVIANPINIVVSRILGIGFTEYAMWMMVPALVSMVISFIALRLYFRKSIPQSYDVPTETGPAIENKPYAILCIAVLAATLIGFFVQDVSGVPTWAVASSGAILLALAHTLIARKSLAPIVTGIGWDVIVFLIGIFIVVMGARNAGMAEHFAAVLSAFAGESFTGLMFTTGFAAAVSSAIIDNHPTADMMSWVIQDLSLPHADQKVLGMAALIGGDLGPKMSPIGSLAALMWPRLLRQRGVDIPYRLFLKINVPAALAAVLVAVTVLWIEWAVVQPGG